MEAKTRNVSPNEIRIGNWIQWEDDSNEQIQVNEITHITGEDYSATNYFFNGGLSLDFIPIPLTEEWIVRFGFVKLKRKGRYGYIYAIGYSDSNLNIEKDWRDDSSHFFG